MAIVYQGDASIVIGSTNISLNASSVVLEVGYETADATVMGATGRKGVPTLQSVSLTATVFLEYGATALEKTIFDEVGAGDTTIIVMPDSGAVGVSNPEYEISNCMIATFAPISTTVGDLSSFSLTATMGTWARATA